jgi:glycosyltransferase involved in cell wall biosynthesis
MPTDPPPLAILHVFRAPVGGLFRHVADVARLQAERGHRVGLIADSTTGGDRAEAQLAALAPHLALGVLRLPMHRNPHPSDAATLRRIGAHVAAIKPDVLHGHGAKGGLYARLPSVFRQRPVLTCYTPHGGSLNYFPGTAAHWLYMRMERLLERGTGLFLFESQFVRDRYLEFVGPTKRPIEVFLNGLHAHEFAPIVHRPDAADLMFIGELRYAKGIDLMLQALARVKARLGRAIRLNIVGSGPDEAALRNLATSLGIAGEVAFLGAMNAREAFALGRAMLVPSRFESMPYVVLEAAGCRQPLIATDVGGIPEIFGPDREALIAPGDVGALEGRILEALDDRQGALAARTLRLHERVQHSFSAELMTDTVIAGYRRAIAIQRGQAAERADWRGSPPRIAKEQ